MRAAVACLLILGGLAMASCDLRAEGLEGQILATVQGEYSYSTETQREIFENWLDVSYYLDGFRTGLLFNARQPSEEGERENEIRHRFFEFSRGDLQVRAGHFHGLFGRGLVFSSYEDRVVRVDTALDGLWLSGRRGRLRARAFTGTPSELDVDLRGLDLELDPGRGWRLGGCGLGYDESGGVGEPRREWIGGVRVERILPFGSLYLECGWRDRYGSLSDERFLGIDAFYGSLDLFAGPFGLLVEAKDYDRFAILPRADGRMPLNRPPSLTREHLYTLLSRNTHNLDPDDEVGLQAELSWSGPAGWSLLASGNRTEDHDGTLLFAEAYVQIERELSGSHRLRTAYGYQDVTREAKGTNHFVIGDLSVDLDPAHSLAFEVEHQYTELEARPQPTLGGILHPGSYSTWLLTLELGRAPHWGFAALLEFNDKVLPEQQTEPGEREGPFPACSISYATDTGGTVSLWAGKRQAGQLCVGGVCKREPAFEGVELFWVFSY